MIKIKDLPLEYVNRYGHINVVTPSGKKVSLKEAYKKYGETHIKENDVPYLTDFLTNQQQLDNATKREVEVALADKNIHNNFNMTSPDEQGTSNAKKVIGPILKGAAVATGLSYLLPQIPTFLTSNLGKQLVEPILKGEITNETVKLLGYKNGWGEGMYHVFGGKDYDSLPWYSKLGLDFTNLGYYGPTTKILTPIDELGKQYINYTTNNVALTEKELAKKIDNIIKDTKLEPTQQTVNEIVLLPKTRTTTYIKPWKESWEPTTRLYRVTGTSGKFEPSRDGTKEYVGMWFTDSPTKPNKYALETWKRSNRTGEPNPLELQYIDIPNSQLEHFRASKIADLKQVEFEPEDFIIPLDYPRLKIPYPILLQKGMNQFKLLLTDLSKYTPHKPIKYNTATSVELEGRPQLYFEAVTDQEPGNISIHFKTDGRKGQSLLTDNEKKVLFEELDKLIPEGYKVSTYGSISKGGVHGLNRLGLNGNYVEVGKRLLIDKTGNIIDIPVFLKKATSHLLGEDAVRMFKEYGGEPIPEGSINGELLRKYVPEARERYGLIGNTDVTDEEIAQALYKHVKELGGNTAAINTLGEPLLLFRGDTKAYTELKERMSPEELSTKKGTMDNSLGNLFLGEFPFSYRGVDRYIGTWRNFNGSLELIGSGTGSKVTFGGKTASEIEGAPLIGPKFGGGYKLYSYPMRYGNVEVYKLPASMMESGVNDLNAFVVRTPAVRDATPEISVLMDDMLVLGAKGTKPHMSTKLIHDKDGFPLYQHPDGTTTPALAGMDNRPGMAEHYRFVLNDAKNKGLGLLRSDKSAPLRDEHTLYTYFALPNFNIRGAKHILPYDLRIPRNWSDLNIYRSILPFVLGGSTLYNTNQKN